MKDYKMEIFFRVSEEWVENGFDLTEDSVIEIFKNLLPNAHNHETYCEVKFIN